MVLASRGGGIWERPPRGVGILVRDGLSVQQVKPRAKAPEVDIAMELCYSKRCCRVGVGVGMGVHTLHT